MIKSCFLNYDIKQGEKVENSFQKICDNDIPYLKFSEMTVYAIILRIENVSLKMVHYKLAQPTLSKKTRMLAKRNISDALCDLWLL